MRNIRLSSLLRRRSTSATMLAAATAAVVVMAVTVTGVPVNHVAANDGSVWVVNDLVPGQFGQFNVPIRQLTALVPASTTTYSNYDLDVLQSGTTVLAVDRLQHKVFPVDVAAGAADASAGFAYDAGGQVALDGGVAALLQPSAGHPTGIWAQHVGTGPEPNISALNPVTAKPLATLPGAEAVAVDTAGDVFAASASSLIELPANATGFGPPKVTPYPNGPIASGAVALTTVGPEPVVVDTTPTKPVVIMPLAGRTVTVDGVTPRPDGPSFAVQQPGPDAASVVIASPTKLLSVGLGGGPAQTLAAVPGLGGVPAQPVELAGCAFGAWSGSPGNRAEVCPGITPAVSPLLDARGHNTVTSTHLVYRSNNGQIILNDDADGAAWTVRGAVAQVLQNADWQRILQGQNTKDSRNSNNRADTSQTPHKSPPELHNPLLYARAGVQSTLHVLDQDTDPGGSILSILNVTASGNFSLAVSPDNQSVILTLPADAVAPVSFQYEVVDGFGLTKSGPVTVQPTQTEKPPTPPLQPAPVRHVVAGGTVSMQVLGNWRDPENDALTVSQATVPAGQGTVSWTSDGLITYSAPGDNTVDTPVDITYQVTDGRSPAVSAHLSLDVLGRGDLTPYPPTAVPDAVKVSVGRAATFSPLANDIFGADPIHPGAALSLAGPVAGLAGLTVSTNPSTGVLTFTPTNAGTYSLTYQAAYGSGTSPATQLLVEAVPSPESNLSPVTTPVSVLIHGQYASTVDVLASDYDPSGGLLSVVGVTAPRGLQATIVDGEYLRVVSTTPQPSSPAQVITYQVSNGDTSAVNGQVTVYWQPPIVPAPPPVVPATYVTVRAGDEIDIPVLASASDPDGEAVQLRAGGTPNAVSLAQTNPGPAYPTGLGSASVAGDYVRYSAPAEGTAPKSLTGSEQVTLSYVVESPRGGRVTGLTYVTVNPTTASLDTAPAPGEVDARTTSGSTIAIPIPTTGVAPDGDSGTVTGIESAPSLGRVMAFTANSITYQAYPTAAFAGGTDKLTYDMTGPSGLVAQGVVRVSVTPPTQVQAPVAVDHYVTAAPGQTVDVNLVDGDIVAPGDQLTVALPPGGNLHGGARLGGPGGSTLQLTAPSGADPESVAYSITDGTAAPSVANVVVRDEPGFALAPFASDYYPTAPVANAQTLKVDVLAKDTDPAGGPVQLVGSPDASVDPSGSSLVIPVTKYPRSVPYEIRSSRTGAVAVGVVHVPAPATGPSLKAGQVIQVPAGGTKVVNISDYITDPLHPIRMTSQPAQKASPAGGLSVQSVDSNTQLTLKASPGYSGPGSLTVQVIDAPSVSAPGAQIATFTIPVQVGSPSPIVRCPSDPIQVVESGPPVDANIAGICAVWTPTGASPNTLSYTYSWAKPVGGVNLGWAPGQTNRVMRVTAGSDAKGGSVGTITVGVQGSSPQGFSTLQVQAIEAGPASISAIDIPGVQTGSTATIDVAQYVSTPLSRPAITVIKVGSASQGSALVSSAGSVVKITPAKGVHGVVTFPIQVSDQGPNRPDRFVNGQITLQVLDNPGAPTNLTGVPGNKQVTLSWGAAPDNGSPIEYYNVTMNGVTAKAPGTSYTWNTGLQNGQTYTFTVTAVNRVGPSPQTVTGAFEPNSIPDAPTGVTAKGGNAQAVVNWTAPFDGGKTIDHYIISISLAAGGPSTETVPGGQTSYTWTGLPNTDGPYSFTIVAHNVDGAGPASSPSNKTYAHTTPATPGAPSVSTSVSTDQTTTTMTVTWPVDSNCNDAQPCASYTVSELKDGALDTTSTKTSSQCSASSCTALFSNPNSGDTFTYELSSDNDEGDASATGPPSSPVYAVGQPSQITDLTVSPGDTTIAATFTLPPSHGASISRVDYYLNGSSRASGSWSSPGQSGQKVTEQIGGLSNGTNYSVQVSACSVSNAGTPGGCGPLSNAATANPYGTPYPPNVSTSNNSNTVTFYWNGGGNNGRLVVRYHVCIDGACNDYGSASQVSNNYGCTPTGGHTITAYVVDSAGQPSSPASATSAGPPGCPTVTVSWGTKAPSSICQGDTSCTYFNISWVNFSSGAHTLNANCASCPGGGTFPTPTEYGSSGSLNNYYAVGYCGHAYGVVGYVDNVQSQNTVYTNKHGC